MELKSSLIVIVLLAATTDAQLLCFHCNDCTMQTVDVQACGINYVTIAPPDGNTLPDTTTVMPPITPEVPPFETTTVPPPETTTPSSPETTTVVPPETTTVVPPDTTTVIPETTTVVPPDTTTVVPEITTVVPPETTTVVQPDTTTVVPPEITTALPPVPTNPTTDGPPTPTLPTTISSTTISTTGVTMSDLATPPITPQTDSRLVIPLDPPGPRYVCVAMKSIVANREVVRRGCTVLGQTVHDTCNSASGGQHTSCSVCMTHLCNRG